MAIKRKKSLKNSKSHAKKMRTKAVELYKQNVNRFRNAHRIHVFGTDVPEPIDSWEKLASKYIFTFVRYSNEKDSFHC